MSIFKVGSAAMASSAECQIGGSGYTEQYDQYAQQCESIFNLS